MTQFVSHDDLITLIASSKKHTIVEALPRNYYEDGHLPGAINIPHDEVQKNASRLLPLKSCPVIVYCASAECGNSHLAAEALRGLGYSSVYEFSAGKKGWMEAGLPLETSGGTK